MYCAGICAGTDGLDGQTYAAVEGPYQEYAKQIYTELRRNVVENVYKVHYCGDLGRHLC